MEEVRGVMAGRPQGAGTPGGSSETETRSAPTRLHQDHIQGFKERGWVLALCCHWGSKWERGKTGGGQRNLIK